MRHVGLLILGSLFSGLVVVVGCSSATSSGGTGATTTGTGAHTTTTSTHATGGHTTTTSGSTTSQTTSGTTTTTMGTGGMPASSLECTIPSPIPSKGACVAFVPGDAGELDAGVDDAGNATTTNCNPVTNAGCTGTDVCGPDNGGVNWFCQGAGSPANIAVCGDCTAPAATCGPGGLCFSFDGNTYSCAQMCCTNADCGAGHCDATLIQNPSLPNNVGICTP